jgi:hypothetical protein
MKILAILLLFSLSTNIYLFSKNLIGETKKNDVFNKKPLLSEYTQSDCLMTPKKDTSMEKEVISTQKTRNGSPIAKKDTKTKISSNDQPVKQVGQHEAFDDHSFSKLIEARNENLSRFLEDELFLDEEVVNDVFYELDQLRVEEDNYFSKKFSSVEENSDQHIYFYTPEDYMFMGKIRKVMRENLKLKLGEQYSVFLNYIEKYNQGKITKSFVPFEL